MNGFWTGPSNRFRTKKMRKNLVYLHFAMLLALAGCATVDTALTGPAASYSCVDGSTLSLRPGLSRRHIEVTYSDEGRIVFQATLPAIEADFGERFSDSNGNTLWLNENKALLVRPGVDQALCHL